MRVLDQWYSEYTIAQREAVDTPAPEALGRAPFVMFTSAAPERALAALRAAWSAGAAPRSQH